MRRTVLVLVAMIAVLENITGARPQVFRAETAVVLVPVSVTRGRNPVAGLAAGDFRLLDNGVLQQIDAVALEGKPIDVTFVAGAALQSQGDQLDDLRANSERVRALLAHDDRLRLIIGGQGVHEVPMRPVAETRGFGSDTARGLGSSLNDALAYALMWPAHADRRHLVVAYTSGLESWSTLAADRIVQISDRADAVLHAVVPGPPPTAVTRGTDGVRSEAGTRAIHWFGPSVPPELLSQWRATYDAIEDAVRRTGGSLHHVRQGAQAFQKIVEDFRSSYVLRYTPRGVDRPGWHEISVKVVRSGSFTVRAKKGYEGR